MNVPELQKMSLKVREHILKMSTDGGCFTGASLSCADLLVYLYTNYLNISPNNFKNPERDYLFLSKGHDVPALYGTFVELGWMEAERLQNHLKTNDSVYWHPNRNVPGIEFHSGSLGHLLSVAIGVAYDCKMRGTDNKILVVLGDGELNEGSVWEACLTAQAYKLDNLIAVVDRNHFQANIRTEELIPLEPITNKFEAFGWNAVGVDGHDFDAMDAAFKSLALGQGKPCAVVADTLRGKGVKSIQERADRWFCNFPKDEVEMLLRELHGETIDELKSEVLIVR
ncbi:MAG TPA: transketolase [Patescibacteria group bacterium]|nr:transketolase [Patescibacteria group bacterium]